MKTKMPRLANNIHYIGMDYKIYNTNASIQPMIRRGQFRKFMNLFNPIMNVAAHKHSKKKTFSHAEASTIRS